MNGEIKMTTSLKQQLLFKKTMLLFARELCSETADEYMATVYNAEADALQEEVDRLIPLARRERPIKATKKVTKKVR